VVGAVNVVRGEVALPAMVLKEAALANNLAVMGRYAEDKGFLLAPHGKTTMAPALFRRQLEAGAWGMTVANLQQAAVAYDAGARRVIVANEVVGPVDARAVAKAVGTPGREIYCLVDSAEGVRLLDRNLSLSEISGRVDVLLEVGAIGARGGVRSGEEGVAVASAVRASEHLCLVGVEGYEGSIAADRSPEALAKIDTYLEALRLVAVRLAGAGAFREGLPILISAGGSKYFDRVAQLLGPEADYQRHDVRLVVRPGCYLAHDHGAYAGASPLAGLDDARFVPALEVWAEVVSAPESGLAIVGLGKRDVPHDLGLPIPLHIARHGQSEVEPFTEGALVRIDDQHGYLRLGSGLRVGDRVGFGISHPCTAFDRWRVVLMVDDDYTVLDRVFTFFH